MMGPDRTNPDRPAGPCRRVGRAVRLSARAFSLIELLMVMIMMGVIGAMAVPRYQNSLAKYRVDSSANRLIAELERARETARAGSVTIKATVKTSDSTCSFTGVKSLDLKSGTTVIEFNKDPYSTKIRATTYAVGGALTLDAWGQVATAGTIDLVSGGEARRVHVEAGLARPWTERLAN